MKLNLKVEWIRKVKNKAVVEDHKWRSPDQWCVVDIEELEEADLDVLAELMEKHKDVKGSVAVKQKITTYRKLLVDAKGVKISRLEPLVMAIKKLMEPTPHKWLFVENEDGHLVPWYVYDVCYHPPDERTGSPAKTEVSLAATKRGAKQTKDIYFHVNDLGDTAYELLRKKGYFIETPEIIEEYTKENLRYQAICGLTGEQFLATGEGYERGDYYSGSTVSMERDGMPSTLVMDDDSEEGESRAREREHVTSKFWTEDKKRKDDGGEADENSVVDLPLQPYVKMFDLKKHVFTTIHVGNLTEYVYDAALIDKLVLPAERKELVSMLVEGADLALDDIVKGKTGGIIVICTGPPGTGKCHGRGTKLLKADGKKVAVEDVRVGDLLMGDDSTPRTVLSLAAGKDTLYRVTPLRGGESFTVNSEHIMVFAESPTKVGEPVGVVEMSLRDFFKQSRTRKHHLKLYRVPVDYPEGAEPTVDPYWLGLWLGDGNAGYTGITTMDASVADYVRAYAENLGLTVSVKEQADNKSSVYTIVGTRSGPAHDNRLLDMLAELGLSVQREEDNRRHGSEKFIPQRYLTGSREVRLALLAGVVDSDGYTAKRDGVYDGTFKSQRFAEEIVQLARSLGYTASVAPKKGTIKSIGFVGDYYRVCLSAVHDLPLKIARRKSTAARSQKKRAQVTGFTLENLGVDDYFGFTLTGNGRYLLADFTVTHNTLTAEVFSEQVKRPLYCVQCSQLGTNEEELEKELKTVLSRAQRWKAILLIDEADVYVHTRGTDIQQNAIVGVFLRVLEYYRGILFMTSNRETIIDDAIMSRATAWIRYDLPDRAAAGAIWRVLAAQYKVGLKLADIELLLDNPIFKHVSGRSIKNLLKLAKLMARKRNQPVSVESIVYVSQFLDLECSKPDSEDKRG